MGAKEFDENDAIAYIRNFIPEKIRNKYSDDDILLLIDTMYDFYEKGDEQETLYDEGDGASDDYNINEIVNYVKKSIRKDPDNQIACRLSRGCRRHQESIQGWQREGRRGR